MDHDNSKLTAPAELTPEELELVSGGNLHNITKDSDKGSDE